MTKPDIHSVVGDEGAALAGALAPSSRSGTRRREPVILEFQTPFRRPDGLEDASSPVEGFESIGLLAVRLVASWSRPRINCCRSAAWEEEGAPTGAEGLPVREG